jgi:hypothetical protein
MIEKNLAKVRRIYEKRKINQVKTSMRIKKLKTQNKIQKISSIIALSISLPILGFIDPAEAFTVTTFSPTGFSDAVAGITGFEIEDFEDTSLIPGLTITWEGAFGPVDTLPNTVSNGDFWWLANDAWDGDSFLTNWSTQPFQTTVAPTRLDFSNSPTSVGFGLSNLNFTGSSLSVNNVLLGDLSSFGNTVFGTGIRSTYIRIDAEEGESINSIRIGANTADFLVFDRLAVDSATPIPEPMTILGTGFTLIALPIIKKARSSKARPK